MGICCSCCQSGLQKGVRTDDLVPLPIPVAPHPPIGNPPDNVNLSLEFIANVSRDSFLKAWINTLACKIIAPGDGVSQASGFQTQIHGVALSNGAIVEEKTGPKLVVSMESNSNSWTVRGYEGFPPLIKGVTNVIEVTEVHGQANTIKIRVVGRWHLSCLPIGTLRYLVTDLYNGIINEAKKM